MKSIFASLLALALLFAPGAADARMGKMAPAQRVQFVLPAQDAPTLDEIRTAIAASGIERGWVVGAQVPGQIKLHILVRGKHQVVVAVNYDATGFSIDYVHSENMNYRLKGDQAYIHPNYQAWVDRLAQEISARVTQS